ncbi:hypothetical protein [Specibacter sp. NPDC078692]|uniref:hypothetical protein n=1 Tax=Specibacter sp. NPDC078692 TaxID=3155818 RepID=UPI0034191083
MGQPIVGVTKVERLTRLEVTTTAGTLEMVDTNPLYPCTLCIMSRVVTPSLPRTSTLPSFDAMNGAQLLISDLRATRNATDSHTGLTTSDIAKAPTVIRQGLH